ncbi:3'-5' exonuclease domain-containing protein 2 [Chitinibacter bivalviorum]|uniref:3'-5' exonuclease n=1 Tax=Chitinibacter bivalviorum TaxID=2739434 RepID=A0A7H9BFA8_9NEIS|nr:3'-5' exonuclease [Chitinibacter bivalviorum]QLG87102.1 3'-5' exonuclease domain-containing protein 2 [Chitinibacter bivalviorum]
MSERRYPPKKEDIALFPPFAGLGLSAITVPMNESDCAAALADLSRQPYLGFDSESRPIFRVGEISRGPHVVQLTTLSRAYIFQLHRPACREVLLNILANPKLVKVGFGLSSDRADLKRNLGVTLDGVLDLNVIFAREGYTSTLGVKGAVAVVLQQKFSKSKRVTTSNWACDRLQDNQLLYAANDAYAALKVFAALDLPAEQLPIHYLPVRAVV